MMENRICLVHWCLLLYLLESSREFCGSSNRGHVTQYFHGWANLRLAMSFTVCICAGFTSVRLRYDLVVPDFTWFYCVERKKQTGRRALLESRRQRDLKVLQGWEFEGVGTLARFTCDEIGLTAFDCNQHVCRSRLWWKSTQIEWKISQLERIVYDCLRQDTQAKTRDLFHHVARISVKHTGCLHDPEDAESR